MLDRDTAPQQQQPQQKDVPRLPHQEEEKDEPLVAVELEMSDDDSELALRLMRSKLPHGLLLE